jgi:Ca-activated chloride channel family protein
MRTRLVTLLTLVLSATAGAQGRLIPRPCPQPTPPPCRDGRCDGIPIQPCIVGNAIVRTSSTVRVEMVNRVLRYEVTETFINTGRGLGEADYLFPLPAGSAFEDLKLSINGELVSGETMNARDARQIYEDIVRRHRDPALVEWMGAGLLRARIFPINPGEEKRVVVRFQSIAQREGSALRVDYVRGTEPASQNNGVVPLVRERPNEFNDEPEVANSFSLTYDDSREYGTPYSPTHRLSVRDRGSRKQVIASGDAREVTILLPLRSVSTASVSVLTHRPDSDPGFALITITPPASSGRATPRDVTFVLDVSGSMRGEKLQQAKAAGHALLSSLSRNDRFRLIDFATDVNSFRDGFVAATPENIRAARRYLDALRAEGSTNISGALEEALDARSDGERLPLIVFLTDGEPTVGVRNPDEIAAIAARRRGDARVFTVGVSADVNSTLIERLAVEGRGTAHFVRAGENVERPVSLLASRLTNPVLTNVRVTVDGVRLMQVLPAGSLDIFAGQDLVLLARYEGDGNAMVRIEGRSSEGRVSWTSRSEFSRRARQNAFVPRLWAAQRIGWLAAEKRRNGGNREMDEEIKSLGERYGIPTEFSSYLVVEPGMDVRRARADRSIIGGIGSGRIAPTVTGAATADATTPPPAAAPMPTANEARFEQSRQAALQRETKTLAAIDSMAPMQQGMRQIGARQFTQQGTVWVDQQYSKKQVLVQVKAFSPLYFELLDKLDGLKEALTIGDEVIVSGKRVAIQVGSTGLERMSAQQLDDLTKVWQ